MTVFKKGSFKYIYIEGNINMPINPETSNAIIIKKSLVIVSILSFYPTLKGQ